MHSIQEKGVCVLCHAINLSAPEDDVETLFVEPIRLEWRRLFQGTAIAGIADGPAAAG
jgi:hypothetical protein